MVSVGIDVSKGKSMMAAVSASNEIIMQPQEFLHTQDGLKKATTAILALGSNVRVVMEATGHYHQPVAQALYNAKIFVSVVNPLLIHAFGDNTVRRVKTDKKDAIKIANYAAYNSANLQAYIPPAIARNQLKMFSRQYNLCIKTVHSLENNLMSLLDKTFPGVTKFFSSQKKKNGQQKWVDFAAEFWHSDIVAEMGANDFENAYQNWCKHNHYQFSTDKAQQLYFHSVGQATTLRNEPSTQILVVSAATQVRALSATLASLRQQLIYLSALLPEYQTARGLFGVGEVTAAQLIAELGDVRRFRSGRALAAYAGIDPLPQQSGTYEKKSTKTSKRGAPQLRKTLFQIVVTHLRHSPQSEPIYQFINRKRTEGKPYFVYMTAAANKFLRIYYAKVLDYFRNEAMHI